MKTVEKYKHPSPVYYANTPFASVDAAMGAAQEDIDTWSRRLATTYQDRSPDARARGERILSSAKKFIGERK